MERLSKPIYVTLTLQMENTLHPLNSDTVKCCKSICTFSVKVEIQRRAHFTSCQKSSFVFSYLLISCILIYISRDRNSDLSTTKTSCICVISSIFTLDSFSQSTMQLQCRDFMKCLSADKPNFKKYKYVHM